MQLDKLTKEERQTIVYQLQISIRKETPELATGRKRSLIHQSLWANYGQGHKLNSITYQDDRERYTLKVDDFLSLNMD